MGAPKRWSLGGGSDGFDLSLMVLAAGGTAIDCILIVPIAQLIFSRWFKRLTEQHGQFHLYRV